MESFQPLKRSVYFCDKKFHVEELLEMVQPKEQFGFIIVSSGLCFLGMVSGDTKKELSHFSYDIPKKHRNGGQSSNRFQRIRVEVRRTFLSLIGEECKRRFLSADQIPNVTGLIIAGAAELKEELNKGEFLGPVLSPLVLNVVDVNYGGNQGFNEAIKLSSSLLGDVQIT